MKDFYDVYGIRVRLSSLLILCGPVMLWLVLFVEEIRTLSGMVVILAILLAFSAVLTIPMRIRSNKVKGSMFLELPTVTLLSKRNELIDEKTRQRYCKKITERTNIDLSDSRNKDNFISAIEWLKANYQSSFRKHLVDEENINFGLMCCLKGVKTWGIVINIMVIAITIFRYISTEYDEPVSHVVVLCVAGVFLLMWIFIVNKNNIKYAAEKYALALLSCLDSLNRTN